MKIKTEWNLGLLYKNAKDPNIEQDIVTYEKACKNFEQTYKNSKKFLKSESELLKALTAYEKLFGLLGYSKPLAYFYYRKSLNAQDQEAESQINILSQRITKIANTGIFFELELGKLGKKTQTKFLKSKKLAHFKYFLERIFITAKYNLSEPEEKILSLKSLPARELWIQSQQKLLSEQSVKFKGRNVSLSESANIISELPLKERRKLHAAHTAALRNISYFAASELTALFTDKKINDELRKLEKPYSATAISYQNTEKSVENLVETVTKNFKISHRFYEVKSKLLKLSHLEYEDRAAKIGKLSLKLTFEESLNTFRKSLEKLGPKYVQILDSYVKNGQIDVFPKQGKRGGAFCSGNVNLPTYVFLNHVDSFRSYKTLAHEMGHAIHAEFSKIQTPLYEGHTISVAEVASTLFENIAFDEIFPRLNNKEKIIALHDRLNDSISTVFRQIACFNFEFALHTHLREHGTLTKEEIAALHNKHMHVYLGSKFKMKENDGYFFVEWPHLRSYFYVYSYAYGQLISNALYKRFKENPLYLSEIEKFLKAGGSKSPEDIFKDIGIDTSRSEFFEEGLEQIEEDIRQLEKLVHIK